MDDLGSATTSLHTARRFTRVARMQHLTYCKNTNPKANLPTPMFWHKVLH
jgi:hypothetical protein